MILSVIIGVLCPSLSALATSATTTTMTVQDYLIIGMRRVDVVNRDGMVVAVVIGRRGVLRHTIDITQSRAHIFNVIATAGCTNHDVSIMGFKVGLS